MTTQHGPYDPFWVANFYDEYAGKEWERLVAMPVDRVSLEIHSHYLRRYVQPGSRVLEIGAGPGRFTQLLAELSCRVLVADISPRQLELHAEKAREFGFEKAVEERRRLDICDLGEFADASFDVVLAYGGPLSYVFGRAGQALGECTRVCKPGGHVLASVMSLWGSLHKTLGQDLDVPAESMRRIIATGDLTPANWQGITHRCHLFRAAEIHSLLDGLPLRIRTLSASGFLSTHWNQQLEGLEPHSEAWQMLIEMELQACASEGCLDAGTHLIVVAQK